MCDPSRSRRRLCRWAGWFFVANTFLYFCIGLYYLLYLPNFHSIPLMTVSGTVIAWVFMISGLLGQSTVFAAIVLLPILLLCLCFPRRWFVCLIGSVLAAAMGLLLIADAFVYHLYHYHLGGVVLDIIEAGVARQVLELSWVEWALAAAIGFLLLLIELGLGVLVWRWVHQKQKRQGWLFGLVFCVSLFISYLLTLSTSNAVTADAQAQSNFHVLVMEAQVIPYYNNVLGFLLLNKNAGLKLETRDDGYFVQNAQVNKPLKYPLHPMHCAALKKPYNIVFIVLDAWRFDMMNKSVTPHIFSFSKKALVFKDNYSGGNATRPGIFSLFYSIPANYWTAMLTQHRGPVFIHQLLAEGYQMGIFRSASLHYPAFDETVFREVKDLQIDTPGAESFDRDRQITKEFKHFINHRNPSRPFFSFVFYDETHNYCESSANYQKPFQPAVKVCNRLILNNRTNPLPYLNRYRNAGHFDDGLVGQMLGALEKHDLLKNTIVVITADHGEEFNESHRDFWGHASDYTPWQIHTPLIVYWPSKKPQAITHFTSHFDVVPTLMQQALGCTNSISDYSVGMPLLSKQHVPFIIVNSYIDYAIVKSNRITRIYPEGNYAIETPDGAVLPSAHLNTTTLASAFRTLNEYFR